MFLWCTKIKSQRATISRPQKCAFRCRTNKTICYVIIRIQDIEMGNKVDKTCEGWRPIYHTEHPALSKARCEWGSASRGSICDSWYLLSIMSDKTKQGFIKIRQPTAGFLVHVQQHQQSSTNSCPWDFIGLKQQLKLHTYIHTYSFITSCQTQPYMRAEIAQPTAKTIVTQLQFVLY